jgi:hypothetical protein
VVQSDSATEPDRIRQKGSLQPFSLAKGESVIWTENDSNGSKITV